MTTEQGDAGTSAEITRLRKLIDAYENQCLKLEAAEAKLEAVREALTMELPKGYTPGPWRDGQDGNLRVYAALIALAPTMAERIRAALALLDAPKTEGK